LDLALFVSNAQRVIVLANHIGGQLTAVRGVAKAGKAVNHKRNHKYKDETQQQSNLGV
jgi:hypothetical protein